MKNNPTRARIKAWDDVSQERTRQLTKLGWTTEHDDSSEGNGNLAYAAAAYAVAAAHRANPEIRVSSPTALWPWEEYKMSGNQKECLAKAGALVLAELERLYRNENE